jgi:hypothetical protein
LAAGTVLAQQLHAAAQHRVAAAAELAAPAGDAGVEHHRLAGLQLRLVCIGFLDDAGAVDAHDLRQAVGDAGAAVAHVQVDAVDGSRAQPHQHLARAALRARPRADGHHLVAAVAGDVRRLHRSHAQTPTALRPARARATMVFMICAVPSPIWKPSTSRRRCSISPRS